MKLAHALWYADIRCHWRMRVIEANEEHGMKHKMRGNASYEAEDAFGFPPHTRDSCG